MIIFEGENSVECKRKAVYQNMKIMFIIYLVMFIIVFPTSLLLFMLDIEPEFTLEMACISFIFLPLSLLMLKMPVKRVEKIVWKRKIEFTEDKVTLTNYINEMNTFKNDWPVSLIRQVKDREIYYEVLVKNQKLVCEKSLLTSGTIDEFENKFQDKIIRKKQKNSVI